MTWLRSIWSRIDGFLAAILLTVAFASLMPARGEAAVAVGWLTDAAIALLFFMHGARLSPEAALIGARQWRLHTMVFLSTFVLFPLLGISAQFLAPSLLPPPLWAGLILLTALPSTVQASIAFTSVAGGNVPAAMCSASASNVAWRFTYPSNRRFPAHPSRRRPLCALGFRDRRAAPAAVRGGSAVAAMDRRTHVTRHARALKSVDYGSILLIVYSAFSQGVVDGIWHQIEATQLLQLALVDAALLATVIAILTFASRQFGFSRAMKSRSFSADRRKASPAACR